MGRHIGLAHRLLFTGMLAITLSASCIVRAAEVNDEWDEPEESGRSFLYKELVLSGFYSRDGVMGLPPDDTTKDYSELSPRPPGNYLGFEYIKTFSSSSSINQFLPTWLPLVAMDLHPRIVYNRMADVSGSEPIDIAPQDFWLRFNPGAKERLMLRLGQFVIPYGVNPILAPRQRFILPLEATDLGLKWDWGLDLKGPLGEYDWEIAATLGIGEGLHTPRVFDDDDRRSFLISGRIGTPTYWDFQNGVSFLYGDLPMIMGSMIMDSMMSGKVVATSRWRVAYDAFYRHGTYLMAGGQLSYGQDGFHDDEEFVDISGGQTADVYGLRAWADWVIPHYENLRLGLQFESLRRDASTSGSDDTAFILELGYSFTNSITAMLDYREEINRSMGSNNDAIYLTFIYYGN